MKCFNIFYFNNINNDNIECCLCLMNINDIENSSKFIKIDNNSCSCKYNIFLCSNCLIHFINIGKCIICRNNVLEIPGFFYNISSDVFNDLLVNKISNINIIAKIHNNNMILSYTPPNNFELNEINYNFSNYSNLYKKIIYIFIYILYSAFMSFILGISVILIHKSIN
jgi:hypothetical protein